ncbi:hypothetical protein SDC9_137649 [bioreactor metagenome]|uniref:Flavin reductase like domain-containing protein n=1 Tax=bioreactor metagenome TaxID=1076179 RepID=A0A645DN49_9ZZZZ
MLQKFDLKTLDENVFSLIGDAWMLVTAGTADKCNTMTASWGGLGVLWHKNVATIYIRPQRYTLEFLDANESFTLSFFGEEYRPQLKLCGAKSGRELDKVKECGFTVKTAESGAPYFEEARLVLVCRKLYRGTIDPAGILDAAEEKHYAAKDYHRIFIGEITEAYRA